LLGRHADGEKAPSRNARSTAAVVPSGSAGRWLACGGGGGAQGGVMAMGGGGWCHLLGCKKLTILLTVRRCHLLLPTTCKAQEPRVDRTHEKLTSRV